MPVSRDPSGRRWVQVEVEVPGTPEQVWQAIATGPGVSSWFVPTSVETDDAGKPVRVIANFGPGMESVANVKSWDPPRSFSAESADLGSDAPPIATEWIVEARAGGKCVVRVVHSLFAATDDWDNQLEGAEGGWPGYFRLLRLVLTYFAGQPSTAIQLMGAAAEPKEAAWESFAASIGVGAAAVGQHRTAAASAPTFAGVVEHIGAEPHAEEILVRLEQPAPGYGYLYAMPMGGQVLLSLRFCLFGANAANVAAREEPLWQAWIQTHFPFEMPGMGECPGKGE